MPVPRPLFFFLLTYALLFSLFASVYAQTPEAQTANTPLKLTAQSLEADKPIELGKVAWRYRAGDDAAWARPDFDDSDWEVVTGTLYKSDQLPRSGWNGIGWFRLRVETDETLRDKLIAMMMFHRLAASEIYLDGKLIGRFGKVGGEQAVEESFNSSSVPFGVQFNEPSEHTIAVRYSSAATADEGSLFGRWARGYNGVGFALYLSSLNNTITRREQSQRSNAGTLIGRASVFLAVGALFLLLFWFYTPHRAHLFFGIYAVSSAAQLFILYFSSASTNTNPTAYLLYHAAAQFCFILFSSSFLLFLYIAFEKRVPHFMRFLLPLWAIVVVLLAAFPQWRVASWLFALFTVGFVFESVRVMVRAVRKRADGAWIVLLGVFTSLLLPLRYLLTFAGQRLPPSIEPYYQFITGYGILVAISIYLARNFAQTNRRLAAELANTKELAERELERERREAEARLQQEQERARFRLIEAENERRRCELEEARQLQLSMLPKSLPQLPKLEIAAYMKPATEVGGDYYDFHLAEDGTLTAIVGDATGHGLKAGTIVTATKSLFNAYAAEPDIRTFFRNSSRALKAMNLRGLFMAMVMVKVKDGTLQVSAAGMPPLLVYRATTGQVEEVAIGGMPLGSVQTFPYKEHGLDLSPGDTVVLMSDGFPERFNERSEMIDYRRAKEVLAEVARQSPDEIIKRFVREGDEWAGGRPQDDDVTFVVLKVK